MLLAITCFNKGGARFNHAYRFAQPQSRRPDGRASFAHSGRWRPKRLRSASATSKPLRSFLRRCTAGRGLRALPITLNSEHVGRPVGTKVAPALAVLEHPSRPLSLSEVVVVATWRWQGLEVVREGVEPMTAVVGDVPMEEMPLDEVHLLQRFSYLR